MLRDQLGIAALDTVEERIKVHALAVVEAGLRPERREAAVQRGRDTITHELVELALASAR